MLLFRDSHAKQIKGKVCQQQGVRIAVQVKQHSSI